ncbi:protein transporter tim9 [Haplosporangium gracile]|uniref:Mitochondrial import inner membrane translocase subunit n=1 Tax=Linnemannia schmuckeri TaxID=64567 RepID=A0A9P5VCH7_9FUNG|nr:protein transporter tim9 [Haplosporangium gracile]KAF9152219.1 protein transporter tim9 [Linnemannia schmuckeri]
MDFSQFNDAERNHLQRVMEQKQMKDFLKLYSGLVERCFTDCVNDFTSKALTTKEEGCVQKCADKFLKHSERVGQRFAEANAEMMGGNK